MRVTPLTLLPRWKQRLARAWMRWRRDEPVSAVAWVEEYEPRVLYSADLAPHAMLLSNGPQVVEQRVLDAEGEFSGVNHFGATASGQVSDESVEIVFVDGLVEEKNIIENQILNNGLRRLEVITLDATRDGVSQISATLAGRDDIAAVHIVSHGADGEIRIGNSVLDAAQLAARHDEIAQWGKALAADADILLYGCDVAADARGQAFVRQLSALTGADVAASANRTGNEQLGGDWSLEFAVGRIESATAIDASTGQAWSGVLATYSVTNTNDNGTGSLRKAVQDANSNAGADTITFNIAGSGVHTIDVSNDLVISDRVTIDGSQNNGVTVNGGLPGIILDGGGNSFSGLRLADGADGSNVSGLVIRDFNGNGIEIEQGADGITISNNFIGAFAGDGTRSGGGDLNTGAGIHINSLFNTIGGSATTDRNVIGGNNGAGILVENPAGASLLGVNNFILGNTIGTLLDGTTALPNAVGIEERDGAQWDYILGNLISRNTGSGIVIGGSGAAVHDVLIGGSATDANTISLNGGDGVTVVSGTHNSILTNSIFGNAGLGIDLRNNAAQTGVTANDAGDADNGGNELQNYPVLVEAQIISGTQIQVSGSLNAAASTRHLVEFFANSTSDLSHHGEGHTYLGSVTFNTDASGNGGFITTLNASLPAGTFISATATNYYTIIVVPVRGSTSEFSDNVVLNNTAPVLDNSRSPQLNPISAGAPVPVGAVGTLVAALVDFAAPSGQVDNVTDPDSGALLGIAITATDTTNGTLYYSLNGGGAWAPVGAVSNNNALLLAANGSTRLYYQTTGGAVSTASALTFRVWDRSTGAAGAYLNVSANGGGTAFSTATDTVALTVSGVNSAPVNTVPGAQSATEDTPLAIGGIGVADANGNLATTQITVNNGVVQVDLAGGAVIVAGADGSGDLTLGGTQTQINAALATLTYQGNNNFSGADTLRVLSTDSAVSPLSDTDTVAITVSPVNDPPAAAGGNVTGTEDTAYVFNWSDFNVSDPDTSITGATAVRMDALPASGVLEYRAGGVWTPVALGQLINKSTVDAGSLRFVPTADESGYDGYATVGVGNLRQDYARFTYTPVQTTALAIVNSDGEANGLAEGGVQNPAVGWTTSGADAGAQNLAATSFTGGHDATLYVNAGATLTQTLGATFTAARNYSLAFEAGWRLEAAYPTEPGFRVELWAGATLMGSMDESSVTGVKGEFVAGVLNMTGSLSGATEGAALQIRLIGTSSQVNFENVSLTSFVAATDVGASAVMTVDIAPVNDAPSATNLNAPETYTEDTALNLTDIVISDIDSATVTATLTLSNPAAGSLNTATVGAVTSTYNAGTGVWSASGAIANVNTLLAGLTFTPTANFNGGFSIATSVSDGVAASVAGNKTFTGVAVNDAPTATNLSAAETYTEDTALNLTDIVISDIDSATVTATLILSNPAAGSLNTATSGAVTSTYNAGTGVWTASGAVANVNTLLAGLTFTPSTNFNTSFTIASSVSDGVAAPITGTKTVSGVAVNDAPTATNLNAAETYTEETALNLTDIVVSDVDSATVTATLTLSNSAAGSLNTATVGAVTSTYNAGTGVWSASGAIANVNTLLAGLTFTPTANFNGGFSIATSISDSVAAPVTGNKAFIGVAVNDAPVASPDALAASEDVPVTYAAASLLANDSDVDGPAPTVASVTSGTGGTVVLNGDGSVTFTPNANFNGTASFTYTITDGALNSNAATVSIAVAPVNDVPVITVPGAQSVAPDTPLAIAGISVSDADGDLATVQLTVTNGALNVTAAGGASVVGNGGAGLSVSGAQADINLTLASLRYQGNSGFAGAETLAVVARDAQGATDARNVAIAVSGGVAVIGGVTSGALTEDAAPLLVASGALTIVDPDPGQSVFVPQSNVAGGWGTFSISATGNWSYSAANTQPAIQQLAAGSTLTERFTVASVDGSASQDVVVTITGADDAPVLVTNSGAGVIEGGALLLTPAMLNSQDVDAGAPPATYRLAATPVAGALSRGATLLVAGDTFTQADIDGGLLTYRHDGSETATDRVDFVLLDASGATTSSGSFNIAVAPVNDAPLAADASVTIANSGTVVFRPGDFGYADAEGDALAAIRITALPATGMLLLGNAPVAANAVITVGDVAAGRLVFTPDAGASGGVTALIGFEVSDGQAFSAAHTVAIAVEPSVPSVTSVPTVPLGPVMAAPVLPGQATPDIATSGNGAAVSVAAPTPDAQAVRRPVAVTDAAQTTRMDTAITPENAVAPDWPAGRVAGLDNLSSTQRVSVAATLPPVLAALMQNVDLTPFTPDNLRAGNLSDSARVAAATGSEAFARELDRVRESVREAEQFEHNILVSSVSAGAGLSVGYVLWLLRGSVLLTSVLSSLPAWRFVDPLPVLGRLGDDEEEQDEDLESVESLVAASDATAKGPA